MAQPAISSGLLAADTAVMAVPAILMGIVVVSDGTNAVGVVVYDDPNSADGTKLGEIQVGASPGAGSITQGIWFGENGVQGQLGLYADVTQAAGTIKFYVYYR